MSDKLPSDSQFTITRSSSPMAIVSIDGQVSVNWQVIEENLNHPDISFSGMAKVFISIRDGTYTNINPKGMI